VRAPVVSRAVEPNLPSGKVTERCPWAQDVDDPGQGPARHDWTVRPSEEIDRVDRYVRVRGAGADDAYDDLSLILNRRAEDAPSDGDPRLREDRALSAELWPLADGRRRRSQKRKRECHDGGHPSTGARNRAGFLPPPN